MVAEQELPGTGSLYKSILWTAVLLGGLLVSAIAVVYISHLNRHSFSEYQVILKERDRLDMEWGQLLLEQSTQASHARVEHIARKKLAMKAPRASDIILVRR